MYRFALPFTGLGDSIFERIGQTVQIGHIVTVDRPGFSFLIRCRDFAIDDHTDPLAELERLEQVSRERWVHFRPFLPTRKNPAGITDRAIIDASIEAAMAGKA